MVNKSIYIITFILLVWPFNSFAQDLLAITYSRTRIKFIDSAQSDAYSNEFVFINYGDCATVSDSTNNFFFYARPGEKMPDSLFEESMGDEWEGKFMLAEHGTKRVWYPIKKRKKKIILNGIPFKTNKWTITPQHKNILGYDCQLATGVMEGSDTIAIWFTKALEPYKARLFVENAPGVVLEAESKKENTHMKYTAIALFKYPGVITFPTNAI